MGTQKWKGPKKRCKKVSTTYDKNSTHKLPEEYSVQNGFLIKSGAIVGLASSGIIEAAKEGFLHVD